LIYVAFDYEGTVISIVNARSLDLANAFWQGRGVIPHSTKNLLEDYTALKDHPTGVFPLFETEEIELILPEFGGYSEPRKFIVVKGR